LGLIVSGCRLLRVQLRFHSLHDLFIGRLHSRTVARLDLAVLSNNELGEVPFDVFFLLGILQKPLVERVNVAALHGDLGEHREGHLVVQAAELFDLFVATWLLPAEVVGREAKNHQTLVLVFGVQRLETFVLRGETALGSRVDHQQNLALVLIERHFLTVDVLYFELVNGSDGRWRFIERSHSRLWCRTAKKQSADQERCSHSSSQFHESRRTAPLH